MKPRERELAAIRHETPDRVPVDVIHVENLPSIAEYLGVDESEAYAALELDGRLVPLQYSVSMPQPTSGKRWSEWGTDAVDDYGTSHKYPLAGAKSADEIEAYSWPNPELYAYDEAAEAAEAFHDTFAVRGPYWKPLFCRVSSLVGMERAMVWMMTEPRLFEAVLEGVFRITYELCYEYVQRCGTSLDIFCYGDDFATQRGLMFDPDLWRRYLKPLYARIFDIGKSAGKFVWFHSCGNITEVLPDLIDIGMDVWETVQLHTLPIPPRTLKREYGRHITFFGAVNSQRLPFLSPEEVAADVNRRIDELGFGGGYICGPDHHIKPDVSAENTLALYDAAKRFRRRGYTLESDQ